LLLPLRIQKLKGFQLPDQGLCPCAPLGAPPPDPRYRLALPRSPCPGLKPPPNTTPRLDITTAYYFPFFILDNAIRQLTTHILQGNHCSHSSDDNTKHYVLPVLWVTSCFNIHRHNAVTTESAARCAHFQRDQSYISGIIRQGGATLFDFLSVYNGSENILHWGEVRYLQFSC